MTVKEVKDFLISAKNKNSPLNFIEFAVEFTKSVTNKGTAEQYLALISIVKSFAGNKLAFSQINIKFLLRYENFLRSRGVQNGVINYVRTFRAIFNKARNLHNYENTGTIKIPHYPFTKYDMPKRKVKSKEHYLTIDVQDTIIIINTFCRIEQP